MDKKHRVLKEIGKVSINFGNLTFASLVLGTIIKGDSNKLSMLLIGGCIVALLIVGGIIMLTAGGE
jgi:hypothetical protein